MGSPSERERCGLGALLPSGCRGRAEAFARRLHSRLTSLGSDGGASAAVADEASWLGARAPPDGAAARQRPPPPIALTQPRLSDVDQYLDFGLLESPPTEECDEPDFRSKLNEDNLIGCPCSKAKEEDRLTNGLAHSHYPSNDSDSDVYYDTDDLLEDRLQCCSRLHDDYHTTSDSSRSPDSVFSHSTCSSTQDFATTSDWQPSLSDDPPSFNGHLPSIEETQPAKEDSSPPNGHLDTHKETTANGCLETDDGVPTASDGTEEGHGAVPESNGCVVSQPNGCLVSESNGCLLPESNGCLLPKSNGCLLPESNGCLLPESNGCLLPESNGCLLPESNGCLLPESNGCLLPESNGGCHSDSNGAIISESNSCLHKEDCRTCNLHNENLANGDIEIYVSDLCIDKDLTIECPVEEQNGVAEEVPTELKKDDEDEGEERIPRVRRCSSLRTGKTPPGTPGRKKIVRFADVLGLDLADVRTFLDEVPRVPTSAYTDLRDVDLVDGPPQADGPAPSDPAAAAAYHGVVRPEKILVPLFQQPGGMANFLDVVREQQVCLENAAVVDQVLFTIGGVVRVRNLDFHKSAHVRYTLDSWRTFADVHATYVDGSCDGFSDKFVFTVYAHTLAVGQKIEFACRFSCRGCQYWDNNKGANYCFQCLPQSSSPSYAPIVTGRGLDDHWGADFYYTGREKEGGQGAPGGPPGEARLSAAVQDYIAASMEAKRAAGRCGRNKQDIPVVFVIVIFSFLFMFLQKVIYSATVK